MLQEHPMSSSCETVNLLGAFENQTQTYYKSSYVFLFPGMVISVPHFQKIALKLKFLASKIMQIVCLPAILYYCEKTAHIQQKQEQQTLKFSLYLVSQSRKIIFGYLAESSVTVHKIAPQSKWQTKKFYKIFLSTRNLNNLKALWKTKFFQ